MLKKIEHNRNNENWKPDFQNNEIYVLELKNEIEMNPSIGRLHRSLYTKKNGQVECSSIEITQTGAEK